MVHLVQFKVKDLPKPTKLSVSGTKYTDKKVKKGKRYYYKVKALRGSNGKSGIAYSAYTATKRSGKVK